MSLLERSNRDSLALQRRLTQVPSKNIATTIVSYEEQLRGRLALAAQANTLEKTLDAYARLLEHVETFKEMHVIPFDAKAGIVFTQLRKASSRIGVMDLKIAAITIANDAILLTRNLVDFSKIPGLQAEDWSV